MAKLLSFQYFVVLFILVLVLTQSISQPMQKRITPTQGSSSKATTSQDSDKERVNLDEFSIYENPDLGFEIKYPSNFHIAEVTSSPGSKIITFRMIPIAPATGAFLSINATKSESGMDFDELIEMMSDDLKPGTGIHTLESGPASISGIPVYKIVQRYENSPYGRDATAVFIGAVRDETSYILSSLSADANVLQQMINSLEFTK
jgi:hypothetical protein